MGLPLLDFMVALFFLMSLVVVARFRNVIRTHDRESYNYLSGGLSVLAVVALLRIYGGIGLFAVVPFLSDPLFFKVLSWIGIITGATFVVSGVSTWLPLARSHRQYGQERIQRLELIKKVQQLAMVETRLTEIMSTTLDYMVQLPDFAWGAVFCGSAGSERATLLTTAGGVDTAVAALQQAEFSGSDFHESGENNIPRVTKVIQKLPPSMVPPSLILPLIVNNHVHGAFLLWNTDSGVSDNDEVRVNLKIAVDIISRKIDLDQRRTDAAFNRHRQQWRNRLAETVDHSKDLRENFTSLAKLMRNQLRSEFVSLAIVRDDGTIRRLTVGAGQTLLDEIGLDLSVGNSHVDYVSQSGKPMFVDHLADETDLPVDDLVVVGGIQSVMALPVTCRREPGAVLTIASGEDSAYESRDRLLLESVVPIIRDLVLDDIHRNASAETGRRLSVINDFLAEAGETSDLRVIFQRAADTLLAELPCTMVRIATFDHDDAFMSSRAIAHDPSAAPSTPSNGHMVMSLMPLHQLARDSGRILMVDQSDAERQMTPAEAGQAFCSEVQSAMLVPVMLGQQVLAVIGIADSCHGHRRSFRRLDVLLAGSISAILALAIQAGLGRKVTGSIVENRGFVSPTMRVSQLRGRIRSSLSGILGSVEMIKSKHKSSDPAFEKYLSIIDKSAQRINDCFTEQAS